MKPCAFVTGGTSGLGWATVIALAQSGWRVIFSARSEQKGLLALAKLGALVKGAEAAWIPLDLEDFPSIRKAAHELRGLTKTIDVLLLNAGVKNPPWSLTADGYETQFQVNYLGHFLLFQLVQDLVLASPTKRVVSVASSSSDKATSNSLENFQLYARMAQETYDANQSFCESKLAQLLFTQALRVHFGGRGLTAYVVCPRLLFRQFDQTALGLVQGSLSGPSLTWANKKPKTHHLAVDKPGLPEALWDWSSSHFTHGSHSGG